MKRCVDRGLVAPDVEPLWIARYDYEPGWTLPVHRHEDYFQLIMVVSGTGRAIFNREVVPLSGGELLFIAPGLQHGLIADPRAKVRTFDVKFRVRRAALARACRDTAPVRRASDPRVHRLLEGMLKEARSQAAGVTDLCRLMLQQLLVLLVQSGGSSADGLAPVGIATPRDDADLCGRLERYLRENCGTAIDQAALSGAMHYSYRHLYARWRERHAMSPLQAVWHFRVERAAELMRYSDHALKRIAEMTGFASIHHFTRVFARITGQPPARWRNRERSGIRHGIVLRDGFVNPLLTIRCSGAQFGGCR